MQILLVASFLVIFLLRCSPVTSQEVEDEREFSYIVGRENGPEHWSKMHKEWSACGKGEMQSPIDLMHERVEVVDHLGRLKRKYKPANATMVNRGHDIMVQWIDGAGAIYLNGTEYILKQLHWHSPTEHSINGRRLALEMHLVHESPDKKIAVFGIMYKTGRPDSFLSEMLNSIHPIMNLPNAKNELGVINPKHINLGSRKYYRYKGSLTTPPCTEGVVWTILKKVRTVSMEQVRMLKEAVNDDSEMNARPIQPLNSRYIHLYRPGKTD